MSAKKKVLILDPPTELQFKGPLTDVITCKLKITNPTDERVYFKVKTTCPKQYTVRPNKKVLLPQESEITCISFHPPPDFSKGGHRFMVQHVIVPPGETNATDIWKNTKVEDIMHIKLKCVFDENGNETSLCAMIPGEDFKTIVQEKNSNSACKKIIEDKSDEENSNSARKKIIEDKSDEVKRLENENQGLVEANLRLSGEVARLLSVDNQLVVANKKINHYKEQLQRRDTELKKFKSLLNKKEQELQTTEIMLTTFKEDFEAERKDRENAHNIKEDEIKKAREEMEKFKAEFDKKFSDAKQSLETQVARKQKQLEKQQTELEKLGKSKEDLVQKHQKTLETNNNLNRKIKELEDSIKELESKIRKADESLRIPKLIDLKRDIGEGGNGVIKEVSLHGKVCAAKVVHKVLVQNVGKRQFEHTKQKFLKECEIYSKLIHPNIVQFLGVYYPGPDDVLPWLVMERLATSLTKFLEDFNQEQVAFYVKISLLHDVALGIQYLHDRGVLHRDLSSNNILLTNNLQAKIADYGMAKLVDPAVVKAHTPAPGTVIFMPPEALSLEPCYGAGVDVFSFGCILIHTITHQLPIPVDQVQTDPVSQKLNAKTEVERREQYLKSMKSFPLLLLTKKCLSNDSRSRPSVKKILEEVSKLLSTFKTENALILHVQCTMEIQRLKAALDEKESDIAKLNNALTALKSK